ncbi:MAG: hypothetical protein CMM02_11225 [Rhodopirellula sp.]|jgi:hypothetical protein|nr:hypothetical protein [Rhodopirellula sp.]
MAFGQKDKSKLTQKVITDKTGKKTTVWVRPDGSESPAEKMKKEVTFTKDTYDPKNKHHWSRAVSDLANKVKNAKTDSEKKEAGTQMNEAIEQGRKHGHLSSEQEKALREIEKEYQEKTGRNYLDVSGVGTLSGNDRMFINAGVKILDMGASALVGGNESKMPIVR